MQKDNFLEVSTDMPSIKSDWNNPLDDALLFDFRKISGNDSPISRLVENIFPKLVISDRKSKEKKLALNNFLTNLYLSYQKELPVAIPRSRNIYSIDPSYGLQHASYTNITSVFDNLKTLGIIVFKNGFYDNSSKKSRYTRVKPSNLLRQWFDEFGTDYLIPSLVDAGETVIIKNALDINNIPLTRPVILKDSQNEIPILYQLTHKIKAKIDFLNKYNKLIQKTEIVYPIDASTAKISPANKKDIIYVLLTDLKKLLYQSTAQDIINPNINRRLLSIIKRLQTHIHISSPLLRKYRDNYLMFNRLNGILHRVFNYGDFNLGGRFYGAEYQSLNGEQRRRILINKNPISEIDYSSLHITMLYHLENIDYREDPYDIFKNIPELRKLMKKVSLICINSKCYSSTIKAINQIFFLNVAHKSLADNNGLKAKDLVEAFQDRHQPIKKYFNSGIGLKLQNKDSIIAEGILKHFCKKGIPCLCIHDSFIVEQCYETELATIMQEKYHKEFGFNCNIKIKKGL